MDGLKNNNLLFDNLTLLALYGYNQMFIMTFDYDRYYNEILKNALKYGMRKKEFWEEEYENYFIYEEAYYERLHETNHIQGLYNYIAINSAMGNKDANGKQMTYPSDNMFVEMKNKKIKKSRVVTKKNLQKTFMSELSHYY